MSDENGRRKLIEVALPLDEINAACKVDKDRKTGTIRNMHKWFAPMPLPAWRALIFAALVDDPGDEERRAYLLDVIKRLVANGADLPDASTLAEAQGILARQFPGGVPAVFDPFCGGGSTLVEAQRLGLPTVASDLNPVPVLISRTLTQLLPPLSGQQPLHGDWTLQSGSLPADADEYEAALLPRSRRTAPFTGLEGLIHDTMYYASRVRDLAWRRLSQYYPSDAGERGVAWLWARTATCPNPACGLETPLATSWWLSKKKGDLAWVEPVLADGEIDLKVVSGRHSGEAPAAPKAGHGSTFNCVACGGLLTDAYLQSVGANDGLGLRMTAVAVDRGGKRVYRAVTDADREAASRASAEDIAGEVGRISLGPANQYTSPPRYGIRNQSDLYTPRQLLKLATFADLVAETHAVVVEDGGSAAWADAVTTLLGLCVGKLAQHDSTQCRWYLRAMATAKAVGAFDRGDYPMMWDFAETSFVGGSVGDWITAVTSSLRGLRYAPTGTGVARREDARTSHVPALALVATDPPYFDAIAYADLSDYFYIWHRRALRQVHPDLYGTVAAPKTGELTAFAGHHGGTREAARDYFISGFTETFRNLQRSLAPGLPMLIIYASKEQKAGGQEETRWSSILTAMTDADLQITGTWPIHGTGSSRMRGIGSNAVATYVAMICSPRPATAGTCSLADFNRSLRRELKVAVHDFQAAGILPVDLAQAAMGPGMQVYSRYRQVVDQAGQRVPVELALRLINAALGEVLDEQEGELDPDSRFAVAWWERHGWDPAPFGEADQLARPQGISVDDVVRAGVVHYPMPGYVAASGRDRMNREWKPSSDNRPTAWEAVHHLADRLIDGGGAEDAARLFRELGTFRDPAQALVYRLHDIAARTGRPKDQERYNALIGSWSDLLALSTTEKEVLF